MKTSTLDHIGNETQRRSVKGVSVPSQITSDSQIMYAGDIFFVQDAVEIQKTPDELQEESKREPQFHMTYDSSWLILRMWSEMLEDATRARIAANNRALRGGVDAEIYADYITSLEATEHKADLELRRFYRKMAPPEIRAWQKEQKGIGEPTIARLLGFLGDPLIAVPHHWETRDGQRVAIPGEPYQRTISQLWAYCGLGDPSRKRKAGMSAEDLAAMGKTKIKALLWNIAVASMKTDGEYRTVYDMARAKYDGRLHNSPCVRCGPSGKPAPEGSTWNLGHQHAAALRIVQKEILRDLWLLRRNAIPALLIK